jgi:hypothetical protein
VYQTKTATAEQGLPQFTPPSNDVRRLAMKRFSVYRIDLYIAQFFTFDAP